MNLKITARKMQINQEFTDYAEQKIKKLERFFGEGADAGITMTTIRDVVILELTVKYSAMLFRAEQSAPDKHDALDAAVDKIIRQIRKNKTRLEKRLHDNAFDPAYFANEETVDEQAEYNIIKRKHFVLRPMSVEEAVLQMNLLGHSFFMFQNAENGLTSVVYRREDGDYAILEAAVE